MVDVDRTFENFIGTGADLEVCDPEDLKYKSGDQAVSQEYDLLVEQGVYSWREICELFDKDREGRKVKCWRLVRHCYNFEDDEFIPEYE